MPSLSPTCIALVKNFEGYRGEPVRLADGRWLVGHGHVLPSAPALPVGEREAETLLKEDLEGVAEAVRTLVLVQITQCQFDALCCFVFSIGVDAFEHSDVLRFLNSGQPIAAACAMESWRMSSTGGAPVVLDALVRRRAVEKSLFLYEGVRAPAASVMIRPEIDPAIARLASAMPAGGSESEDETARKLRAILAQEPQTAPALQPPLAAPEPDMDPDPEPKPKLEPKQRDLIGHVALGALGLLLIAMGVTGAGDDHGVAHIVFTVPGIIASMMSAFYLLKSAAN